MRGIRVKIRLLYLMLLGMFGITSCSSINTTVDNIVEVDEMNMILKINDTFVDATFYDNASVKELKRLAKDTLVISMHMYGGFEQVGSIGHSLPSSDQELTTDYGDIVLYSSNQLVIFYGSNTWNYTKLGHIHLSKEELKTLLSNGDVVVTLSLGEA